MELSISFIPTAQLPFLPPQIQVQHPAAKSIIEISRTQDEEVGDGTTSVIVLGELWSCDPGCAVRSSRSVTLGGL